MAVQNSVLYQIWTMRITLTTTFIVVVLSWINAVRLSDLVIRGGISFGVMYFLMAGILSLFEKTAPKKTQTSYHSSSDVGRGEVIDFSVGDDEATPHIQPSSFPGQVDPSLGTGLQGSKQQAEIVRRMGWD